MALPLYPASSFPDQKTAIVTGAASERGIGRAIASRLARDGWSLLLIDRDTDATAAVADAIGGEHGVAAIGVGADITDRDAVQHAVDRAERELPQLVALVNNAGVSSPVPFLEVDEAEWRRVIEVNLNGTFHVTQAAARVMARHSLGRIVNISSASAQRGGGVYGRAAYSASRLSRDTTE